MAGVVNVEGSFTPEENARAEECAKRVQEVLDAHGCRIAPIPFITRDGRIDAEAHIIVKHTIEKAKVVVPRLDLSGIRNGGR